MAIRSSINFTYNNVKSTDMGIVNVNVSSGMLDEPFMAGRSINETKIKGRDKGYFSGIVNNALSFTLSFAFKDPFNSDNIRAVARWLFTDYYKPLIFSDNMDRIYLAIVEGDSRLIHSGMHGYINLTFRCSSPFSYSPTYMSPTYDLTNNPVGGTIVTLNNLGDLSTRPEIYIDKVNGGGSVEIVNLSNSGVSTKFSTLVPNPTIAPVMSTVSNGATLPAVKYYVRYTWVGTSGESNVSTEVAYTVVISGFSLVVTIPALPSGVNSANIYIGTASGSGTLQGSTSTTTFTKSTPLIVGASAPMSNNTGLLNNENVYVDSENELIMSDQPNTYRYNCFSNNYLELIYGNNSLQVFGACLLRFRYRFTYLQG